MNSRYHFYIKLLIRQIQIQKINERVIIKIIQRKINLKQKRLLALKFISLRPKKIIKGKKKLYKGNEKWLRKT